MAGSKAAGKGFRIMSGSRSVRATGSEYSLRVREIVAERVGKDWCLFLDRDGVINRRIVDSYVRNWDEFEWLPRARAAVVRLGEWAPHVVVVTNQQGIGKGLMTETDVSTIHEQLQSGVAPDRRTVEAFQVCPHLESESCRCRKPQPALVLDWLSRHPHIDPTLSVIVGDTQSDLELAQNVAAVVGGCASIKIGNAELRAAADASFDTLWDFAIAVCDHQEG